MKVRITTPQPMKTKLDVTDFNTLADIENIDNYTIIDDFNACY